MMSLSEKILLKYCQSWGQSIEEKIAVLNEAIKETGINAKFIQYKENGKIMARWEGSKDDSNRALQFREELEMGWCKGNFEEEVIFVASLIDKYKLQSNQSLHQT